MVSISALVRSGEVQEQDISPWAAAQGREVQAKSQELSVAKSVGVATSAPPALATSAIS